MPTIKRVDEYISDILDAKEDLRVALNTYGNLNIPTRNSVSGLQFYDYIQSSGTQYINTGINPKIKPRVVAEICIINNEDKDYWGNSAVNGSAYYADFASARLMYYRYGSTTSQNVNYTVDLNTWHTWDVSDKVYVDGDLKFTSANTYTYSTSQSNIQIFKATRASYYSSYKLRSFKLYDGDVLVRYLIPCSYNGSYGLWDLLEGQFYGNQGTGTFSVGDSINQNYLLKYYPGYIDSIDGPGLPEAEPNDVNFFDYDGTLRYSYSASDFADLTELPPLPTHEGLTSQEWNWTLSDAQDEVTTTGELNIGLTCCTDDGHTRLFLRIPEDNFQLQFNYGLYLDNSANGTCTYSFTGPGTVTGGQAHTPFSSNGNYSKTLTFSKAGDYVLTITTITDGRMHLGHYNTSKPVFGTGINDTDCNYRMCNVLYKIWMGTDKVVLTQNSFYRQMALETIAISKNVLCVPGEGFYTIFKNCYSLKFLVYPNVSHYANLQYMDNSYSLKGIALTKYVKALLTNCCYQCQGLKYFVIPSTVSEVNNGISFYGCSSLNKIKLLGTYTQSAPPTSISSNAFRDCYLLHDIRIPNTVTTINSSAFENCYELDRVYFGSSVSTIGANAFKNCKKLSMTKAKNALPSSITSLGNTIFDGCTSLTSLWINATTPPTITSTTFNNSSISTYNVPAASFGKYLIATNWSNILTTGSTGSNWYNAGNLRPITTNTYCIVLSASGFISYYNTYDDDHSFSATPRYSNFPKNGTLSSLQAVIYDVGSNNQGLLYNYSSSSVSGTNSITIRFQCVSSISVNSALRYKRLNIILTNYSSSGSGYPEGPTTISFDDFILEPNNP